MGAVLVRIWLIAIACWSCVWVLAFCMFLYDDPPAVSAIGFEHIWVLVAFPWAGTLLAELVLIGARYFVRSKSRSAIHIVLNHESKSAYRGLWI
jgi:hypothetical protein